MMAVFLLLDRPRYPMKRTILFYIIFGVFMVLGFSAWYVLDWEGFVRFAGLACMPPIGIFCGLLSEDGIYLSLYKISLGFYLLSVCVFLGGGYFPLAVSLEYVGGYTDTYFAGGSDIAVYCQAVSESFF